MAPAMLSGAGSDGGLLGKFPDHIIVVRTRFQAERNSLDLMLTSIVYGTIHVLMHAYLSQIG